MMGKRSLEAPRGRRREVGRGEGWGSAHAQGPTKTGEGEGGR